MSDKNREYDDESYAEQFHVDISDDSGNTDQNTEQSRDVEDFKSLRAELNALKEQNSQLLSTFANRPAVQVPVSAPQSAPDINYEELGKDPKALAEFVTGSIKTGLNQVQSAQLRSEYERKLNEDFPALKTNKKYEAAVIEKVRELVFNGEYTKDSPALVYRAAELVAGRMGDELKNKQNTSNRETSLQPSRERGVARNTSIKDNDPRLAFAVAAGITDSTKLAKFKKDLQANYGSTEEHMRERGQLKPRGRRIGGKR